MAAQTPAAGDGYPPRHRWGAVGPPSQPGGVTAQPPPLRAGAPASPGATGLMIFARGDRVFPIDDLGGGVWSRRGTVLAVHMARPESERAAAEDPISVDAVAHPPSPARATVLWDDGAAEVLGEDRLCLVYDQEAPVGVRVVTMPMREPADVVQHGGHVILVLREGLLARADLAVLREKLRGVRAVLTPERVGERAPAEVRRRDLGLLRALIAHLTDGTS